MIFVYHIICFVYIPSKFAWIHLITSFNIVLNFNFKVLIFVSLKRKRVSSTNNKETYLGIQNQGHLHTIEITMVQAYTEFRFLNVVIFIDVFDILGSVSQITIKPFQGYSPYFIKKTLLARDILIYCWALIYLQLTLGRLIHMIKSSLYYMLLTYELLTLWDSVNSFPRRALGAVCSAPSARRWKLFTWAIYFPIVSSTISIQIYNSKSKNEEK